MAGNWSMGHVPFETGQRVEEMDVSDDGIR